MCTGSDGESRRRRVERAFAGAKACCNRVVDCLGSLDRDDRDLPVELHEQKAIAVDDKTIGDENDEEHPGGDRVVSELKPSTIMQISRRKLLPAQVCSAKLRAAACLQYFWPQWLIFVLSASKNALPIASWIKYPAAQLCKFGLRALGTRVGWRHSPIERAAICHIHDSL